MNLTPRKRKILQVIIQNYIDSAEPVGSRTIARKYKLGISPATIRNEMADLEDMGFLSQPHTSSGRIPSDKGYRAYVDGLMPKAEVNELEIRQIEATMQQRIGEKEKLIHALVETLSTLTEYTAIVSGPFIVACTLRRITLIPIYDRMVMAIIVTNNGLTASRQLMLPESLYPEDIEVINRILNDSLVGKRLQNIATMDMTSIMALIRQHINRQEYEMSAVIQEILLSKPHKIFAGGILNILNQPEFRDLEKYMDVMALLNHSDELWNLLHTHVDKQMSISIGQEMNNKKIQDCSMVTIPYEIGGQVMGVLGVLGPRRMTYARVISLLQYVSGRLTDILEE